jgi:hypothetical protein
MVKLTFFSQYRLIKHDFPTFASPILIIFTRTYVRCGVFIDCDCDDCDDCDGCDVMDGGVVANANVRVAILK